MSAAGRLEFVIYKESPQGSCEVKSIPIEEFGGLETNLKLDIQEKYTFAIITTDATDCFASDSPEEYTRWTSTIREYLGKGKIQCKQNGCLHVFCYETFMLQLTALSLRMLTPL